MSVSLVIWAILLNPGFSFLSVPRSPEPFWAGYGAWGGLENPAEEKEGILSFAQLFWMEDSKVSTVSLGVRSWTLGISYFDQGAVEYMGEVPDDSLTVVFHPYAVEFQLSRSFSIDPELSVGIGASYFAQKILEDQAAGGLLHAGLLYTPQKLSGLRAGFFVRDFGIKTGFHRITYKMPTKLGLYGVFRKGRLAFGVLVGKVWTFPYPDEPSCGEDAGWLCSQGAAIGRFFRHFLTGPGSFRRLSMELSLHQSSLFLVTSWGTMAEATRVGVSIPVKGLRFTYAYALTRYGFGGIHLVGVNVYASRL